MDLQTTEARSAHMLWRSWYGHMGVDKSQDPSGEDLAVFGLEPFSSRFFCPLDFAGGFFS